MLIKELLKFLKRKMLKKSDINLKEWEFEFQQRSCQPFLKVIISSPFGFFNLGFTLVRDLVQ